ncbi:unnamed protein product [Citrullus colocynthis]|uniref:Uncharacterized protein n=1 Tax=Citrullus colocynthis TaxID=252529 RepID=A0ABP0YNM7_9ROSI
MIVRVGLTARAYVAEVDWKDHVIGEFIRRSLERGTLTSNSISILPSSLFYKLCGSSVIDFQLDCRRDLAGHRQP